MEHVVGRGAVPGPRERPPPRPEQYGAVPHIDSGILPRCPSIVRRYGLPLCTGRGRSSYAVNEASRSPIGPGALQAPGHPRAAAAALLRCCWRGPGPGPAAPPPGEAARAGAADPGPFAHRPAAVVIGTAAVKTVLPEIPPETLAEWQRVVDLTARLARVPASLIMRTERPQHTVLVSSRTEGNPYDVGREYDLNASLYCQGVFENDGELVVEDATRDPVWAANEDLAYGMRFYIGYPLKWPSGEVFGTICVLDRERNDHALLFREGLQAFAGVVEANLRSLVEIAERRRLETALQHSLDQTARQVVERTSELQDANTALRVLLGNVEKSHEARNEQMLQQINTLVMPHVAKLARRMSRAVTDYKGMKAMMRIILIGVSLAVLSVGCRQDPLAELREGAQGILDDARTRANDVRELSAAELQALWAIEYTSLEVAHADLRDVDERLNAMGRERWECYHVSEHEQGRVFYFKRRTSTAVAYLTNLLRVGAVAF